MKFFPEEIGLKSDIGRHRQKEKELREKIKELENIENKSDFDYGLIAAYSNALAKLLESKVNILNKLGRK